MADRSSLDFFQAETPCPFGWVVTYLWVYNMLSLAFGTLWYCGFFVQCHRHGELKRSGSSEWSEFKAPVIALGSGSAPVFSGFHVPS